MRVESSAADVRHWNAVHSVQQHGTVQTCAKSRQRVGLPEVLEIGPYPPPWTGWSTRSWYLVRAMRALGWKVHVLVPRRTGGSEDVDRATSGVEFLRKVVRHAYNGTLIHLHINAQNVQFPLMAAATAAICRAMGARLVVTFHAGSVQTYFPAARLRCVRIPLLIALRNADAVICNDEHVSRELQTLGIRHVFPIPAFCAAYLDAQMRPNSVARALLARGRRYIVTYVENRWMYHLESLSKGLATVLVQQDDMDVVVVGDPDAGLRDRLPNPLRDRIHEVGYLDRSEFLWVLKHAALYLRSAYTEGASSSIREALALGTPVVANHSPHHPSGVLCYRWGNHQEMAQAVLRSVQRNAQANNHLEEPVRDTIRDELTVLAAAWYGCVNRARKALDSARTHQ